MQGLRQLNRNFSVDEAVLNEDEKYIEDAEYQWKYSQRLLSRRWQVRNLLGALKHHQSRALIQYDGSLIVAKLNSAPIIC